MERIKSLFFIITLFTVCVVKAQRVNINGQLIAEDEVEGLHILNKTALKYTISSQDGSFVIPAKVSDTLIISGVKYQKQEFIITQIILDLGLFNVYLIENISELNEVVVGKILTGRLESDLNNSDAQPEINFYDLGIPGFKGKPLTQNERKLHDADAGPNGAIEGGPFGAGVSLNLHKLLNNVSGRTKKLKGIVELDDRERCMVHLKQTYESFLFEKDSLAENLRNEYFLFCQEDEEFLSLCKQNNEIQLLEFLQSKLKAYRDNRASVSQD